MEERYITPEEQAMLDPFCNNRNFLRRFPAHTQYFSEPSRFYDCTPSELYDAYQSVVKRLRCAKHAPYFDYVAEIQDHYGPQGGRYPISEWKEKIREYYDRASSTKKIHAILRKGRDYLLRRIKERIKVVGYPQVSRVAAYEFNKAAALPTGLHKGNYLAETLGAKTWRHSIPILPGQRVMWGKNRAIFQASVLDVRYIEHELTAVRDWLKRELPEYFGSWLRPDVHIHPHMTDAVRRRKTSIETDYIGMDKGFSWFITSELILPIYELLIPDSYLSFASMIEEMFSTPVYWGDVLWEGLHNLLSGLPPTNDFETEYTVELALGVALTMHCNDDVDIHALGDDAAILLPSSYSQAFARKFREIMIEVSSLADMLIHDDEKSRIACGNIRYLRRVYYPAGYQDNGWYTGNYPMLKALNNIIQPEKPIKREGVAAVADLQRLDNAYGVPEFVPIVQYLVKHSTHKFNITQSDIDEYNSVADWWQRLYGEKWSPTTSPTFQLIFSSKFL